MGQKRWMRLPAALALAAVVLAACGGGRDDDEPAAAGSGEGSAGQVEADPGITDAEIKIGGSLPLSGPGSAYNLLGRAAKAYFDSVNDAGGVRSADGKARKITYTYYDDAFTPPRAQENVQRLVQQDEVFATFQLLGTANNLAVRDFLNKEGIPQLYVSTGSSKWGAEVEKYPYIIGFQPAYTTEAAIAAEFLKQERPNAKVAMLYQNDDFGKDLLAGFEEAIQDTGIQLVAPESYALSDPTVDSQVVAARASGADVFLNYGQSKQAAQAITKAADLGWKPLQILGSFSASVEAVVKPAGFDKAQGIYTAAYVKDPGDPQWDDDEGMKRYRDIMARYAGDVNVVDSIAGTGYMQAQVLVKALEGMRQPTRDSLMESVRNMSGVELDLLLPGVRIDTGPDDGFPIEAVEIARFEGERFALSGDIIDYEDKTPVPAAE